MSTESVRHDKAIVTMFVAATIVWSLSTQPSTEIAIARIGGPSYVELPDGQIASAVRVRLENESDAPRHYTINVRAPDAKLRSPRVVWEVPARKSLDVQLYIDVPRARFESGRRKIDVYVDDSAGFHRVMRVTLLGPKT